MGSGFKDWTAGDVLTAADVDGYLMRQTVMTFADASARDTALSGVLDEGMVAYLEDTNEVTVYDGSDWVIYAGRGYSYVQTVYFTSSGTFTKATYPWLRAVRIKILSGGGAGGGTDATYADTAGAGGGGGGYAERFVSASSLSASESVVVGAGGTGVTAGDGNDGGNSSFFGITVTGGGGGEMAATNSGPTFLARFPGRGGWSTAGTVDLNIPGDDGYHPHYMGNRNQGGNGGGSFLGGGRAGGNAITSTSGNGNAPSVYGGGGSGAANRQSAGASQSGGNGGQGLVFLELFA